MSNLYRHPELGLDDLDVIDEIQEMRESLAAFLRAPKRWSGGLRRTAQAKAIQGSNSIEGYTVTEQDAGAAVDAEPPLTADEQTWAEIVGYRRVLTYVLNVATEPGFIIDESAIRGMHFMLLEHDLAKSPGRYRPGAIYVHDDRLAEPVYEGPDATLVPELMRALVNDLATHSDQPMVRAAMAHLNLVMIHPFRDGNGRMARALQTMAMAQDQVLEPTFSSVEEWLGSNTDDYYQVLAATGAGAWNPDRDARMWVQFNLRAHHMQAQTMRRRFAEAEKLWASIDELVAEHNLPERVADALFDALLGMRVTRPTYVARTDVEDRTASRDLAGLVDLGMLTAHGQTRARHYTAGPPLLDLTFGLRRLRSPLTDPYPHLMNEVRAAAVRAR